MRPADENWQDSGRNNGAEGEGQNERKSFNPNFTSDNRVKGGEHRTRRRIGAGSSFSQEGENRGGYNHGGYNNNRGGGYGNNRGGGYGNNRGGGYGNNRGGYGNNHGGYNNNRGYDNNGYNDNRGYNEGYNEGGYDNNGGGYNNNRGGGYNNNRGGGYNNNRGGGYNNNRGGGYNNNRGGGYNNNRGGGYNNNRGGGFDNNRGGGYNNNRGGGFGNHRPNNRPMRPRMPQPVEYEIEYNPEEEIRLNKFLANAGVCSRRDADQLIEAGAVSVNDVIVTELGTKIRRSDKVMIDGQTVNVNRRIYVLLNKPKDCVTTTDDPNAKLTVMDLVKGIKERIYPVGRLDRNTTGVLLLTNDGDLAAKLTHPQYNKKKVYEVSLDRAIEEADFNKILEGITLEDGDIKADNLSFVDPENPKKLGIEIHSGRNRIVRRIFEHLGYRVTRLDRTYFAGLTKKNLTRGKWRHLSNDEVVKLRSGLFD